MIRMIFSLLLCVASASALKAQEAMEIRAKEKTAEEMLAGKKNDTRLVDLLIDLSSYFLYKDGEAKNDLEKSKRYSQLAKEISRSLNYKKGYNEAMVLSGTASIEGGDLSGSAVALSEARDEAKARLLLNYSGYHRWGGVNPSNLDSAVFYAAKAREAAAALNNPSIEAKAIKELLDVYLIQKKYHLSDLMLQQLETLKRYSDAKLHEIYYQLGDFHNLAGNFDKALFYALEAIKHLTKEGGGTTEERAKYYSSLGHVYRNVGQFEKSIENFELSYNFYKQTRDNFSRLYMKERVASALQKMGRHQQALAVMKKAQKDDPPQTGNEAVIVLAALGNCYKSMGLLKEAEQSFLQAVAIRKDARVFDPDLFKSVGQFYIETGRYEKARPFLEDAAKDLAAMPAAPKGHLYFLLFRMDSAAGNYLSAINHLINNKAVDDSITQQTKVRQIEELQVKYETEQKEQALKLKEQNILLLTNQSELRQRDLNQVRLELLLETQSHEQRTALSAAESEKKDKDLLLKQQNIDHLHKEAELKQASLQAANTAKNLTLAGIGLSLIIILLLYNQFRIKQRKNKEISQKNSSLERLITERERLLKEVHHRVKNNLQTIMSLLETQSSYLKDDAFLAIQNSKHRVYAMSLIHQKLYRVEQSTSIDLSLYLPELIYYLSDCYDVKNRVQFRQRIESIHLDISQAIPVGLIVNEAVSNSLKYAFPDGRKGLIDIETVRTASNAIHITLSDNGIGLPSDWERLKEETLGLKLMKGLSDDIQAKFSIRVDNGTTIQLEFQGTLLRSEDLPA